MSEKLFDPNGVAVPNGNLWALPFTAEEAECVIFSVPWEVTVSFRGGTRAGPDAIRAASPQIDYYDPEFPNQWKRGIALAETPIFGLNLNEARRWAREAIQHITQGGSESDPRYWHLCEDVNKISAERTKRVFEQARALLSAGKIVGVLGGDHSTPLGLMKAVAKHYGEVGVLHVDAHLDLRPKYEGFQESHASIMWNAAQIPEFTKFVHAGIRDCCEAEVRYVHESNGRHQILWDRELAKARIHGCNQRRLTAPLIAQLPQNVYVSFDIDGLEPSLCPNTGTPVPGGFRFEEALDLISHVVASGRRIVGFDLVEVAPAPDVSPEEDWDANVGMRVLYRLACAALASNP